jgi:uncharacterized protein
MAEPIAAVEAFWRGFADATGVEAPYEAWAFGGDDTPELATELGLLVRDGPKRATTGLLASYEAEGEALPAVGGYSVILDGGGEPVCVIRTTRVDTVAFGEVDEEFAWVEGEGDRSLAYWRDAHRRFFADEGTPVADGDAVVLERFELVWPGRAEHGHSMDPTEGPAATDAVAWRVADVPLAPGDLDPAQVLAGSPAVTEAVLSESADGRVVRGVWRITEGTVTDVEHDEMFVVLEGRATIEVEGGPTVRVGPGDVCVLQRGARTTWTVHEAVRKVFQITLPVDGPGS